MEPKKIRIEVSTGTAGTRVWIDDVEQHDLRSVSFHHRVGYLAELELTRLVLGGLEVGGQVEAKQITIKEIKHDAGKP